MPWLRTVPVHRISSLSDIGPLLGDGPPGTLVLDVDNTIVPLRSRPAVEAPALEAALDELLDMPRIHHVVLLSNRPGPIHLPPLDDQVPITVTSWGGKPFTRQRTLTVAGELPIAVCGDQPIADGLLAWRLGVPFFHLVVEEPRRTLPTVVAHRIGEWLINRRWALEEPGDPDRP